MFFGLRHRAIRSGNDEDRAIDLGCTGDHVLNIVAVTRHIDMSVVAVGGFIFNMSNVDGDTTGFFFRGVIDLVVSAEISSTQHRAVFGDRSGQSGFTVVNVTHCAHIQVGLASVKMLFCHFYSLKIF